MILFLVDECCREAFEQGAQRIGREAADQIRAMEYSELADCRSIRAGAVLFTGVSLMDSSRLSLILQVETALEGIPILNRPSGVRGRLESLQDFGLDVNLASESVSDAFPRVLRFDHPAGFVESPPLESREQCGALCSTMIMASYPPAGIWESESLYSLGSELRLGGTSMGGLDVVRVDFRSGLTGKKVWRLDDGACALLPRRGEESRFAEFAASFGSGDRTEFLPKLALPEGLLGSSG